MELLVANKWNEEDISVWAWTDLKIETLKKNTCRVSFKFFLKKILKKLDE